MTIRVRVFGYQIVVIDVDLPTPAETVDAFDDAVDDQVREHVHAWAKWFR